MEALLAHCTVLFPTYGGVFLAFFLGGLTGGFTHCIIMCGPYVVCERMCSGNNCSLKRSSAADLGFSYHIGRFITYGALGFLAAYVSSQATHFSWWPAISSAMLALAGIMFLLSCLKACKHSGTNKVYEARNGLTFLKGITLGFIPCGLLYAALLTAATLANPISGMFAMWLFTLGTVPALIIASLGADYISRKWRHNIFNVGRAMMAFNGLSLLVMAARVVR